MAEGTQQGRVAHFMETRKQRGGKGLGNKAHPTDLLPISRPHLIITNSAMNF